MRSILLSVVLVLASVSIASGQTAPPPAPVLTITPATGDLHTAHEIRVENMSAGAPLLLLFAPDGSQTVLHPYATDTSYVVTVAPPSDGWTPGLYRVVLGLAGGAAESATFTAGTDSLLYVGPPSPSPASVFNIVGTNLPPNTSLSVHLFLTGGIQGERVLPATTDAAGAFSIYAWPEALGFPFFPAGIYRATLPQFNLETEFTAREHPLSATLTAQDAVTSGAAVDLHFTQYQPNRYLWGVFAPDNGAAAGEFLVGPTGANETADATLTLGPLTAGQYYVATPYDWGETTFTVLASPTATPTSTPTLTPVPTPTPRPKCKKGHVKKGHKKKRCKR